MRSRSFSSAAFSLCPLSKSKYFPSILCCPPPWCTYKEPPPCWHEHDTPYLNAPTQFDSPHHLCQRSTPLLGAQSNRFVTSRRDVLCSTWTVLLLVRWQERGWEGPLRESVGVITVTDAHILSYFSVFYTDLFDEVFVFESLSLIMIRWLVTCCHHVHS